MFLLTRSSRYHFDLDAVREPHAQTSIDRAHPHHTAPGRSAREGLPYRGLGGAAAQTFRLDQMNHSRGHNPGDVWTIPVAHYRKAHFATFPPALARRCLLAGCPPRETVLDPFVGAGTTLMVARQLRRRGVGIDVSADYLDLAVDRISAGAAVSGRAA